MKFKAFLTVLIFSLSILASSRINTGTLKENVLLKDENGKTYDMFSLLDEGKYFLIHYMAST